jgi:hypothetical protein
MPASAPEGINHLLPFRQWQADHLSRRAAKDGASASFFEAGNYIVDPSAGFKAPWCLQPPKSVSFQKAFFPRNWPFRAPDLAQELPEPRVPLSADRDARAVGEDRHVASFRARLQPREGGQAQEVRAVHPHELPWVENRREARECLLLQVRLTVAL